MAVVVVVPAADGAGICDFETHHKTRIRFALPNENALPTHTKGARLAEFFIDV